jgi:hypothetical protein
MDIKKYLTIALLLILLLTACSTTKNEEAGLSIEDILKEYQQPGANGRDASMTQLVDDPDANVNSPNCYTEGAHPIGASIAEQFPAVTSYDEVMLWFCNGALFEDILNALATEELSGVNAEATLRMIAEGFTWDEIWLELGVTDQ